MKPLQLTGYRSGRLVAVRVNGRTPDGRIAWLCKCDCGNTSTVAGVCLNRKTNPIRSCGCLWKDGPKHRSNYHGLSHSTTMISWGSIITRCYNKKSKDYRMYGARGITTCAGIKKSIMALVVSIGERPVGTTIDRINNAGNYTCGKCAHCVKLGWMTNIRWATPKQQGRNTSTNHHVTIDGKTMCIVEWAENFHLKKVTLRARLVRGWSGVDLLRPVLTNGNKSA